MASLLPQAGHFGLILPLCSSSATVGLALYQYPQFTSFLQAKTTGKSLSRYWDPMIKQGTAVVTVYCLTSGVSGLLAARWLKTHQTLETSDVGKWYTYGSVLAAAHMAFLPLIAGPIKRMIDRGSDTNTVSEEKADEDNKQDLKTWFMIHTIRTLLVDVPALWCFAEGAAQSFWVSHV